MGEQGVFLKHGVHLPPVRRNIINPHTVEKHIPGGRLLKTTDDTQGGRLAATAGAEQCEEFLLIDFFCDTIYIVACYICVFRVLRKRGL